MTRKQKRLSLILGGLAVLGFAAGLVLYALRDTIVFFYTPSEITEKKVPARPAYPPWRPGREGQHQEGKRHSDKFRRHRHAGHAEGHL